MDKANLLTTTELGVVESELGSAGLWSMNWTCCSEPQPKTKARISNKITTAAQAFSACINLLPSSGWFDQVSQGSL